MNRAFAIIFPICVTLLLSVSLASARPVRMWSFQELNDKADLVVVATVASSADAKDHAYPEAKATTGVAIDSVFNVAGILKGELKTPTLTVRHYRYYDRRLDAASGPEDGPCFLKFPARDSEGYLNQFLMFLQRSADACYEPLSGQGDPHYSIFLLQGGHVVSGPAPVEDKTKTNEKAAALFPGISNSPIVVADIGPFVPWPTILSPHPLFSAETDIVFKPELLGTWASHRDAFTFEPAGDKAYFFSVTNRLGQERHKAYLVKVGEHLFLDVCPAELPRDYRHNHQTQVDHLWRLHSFMLVQGIGPKLSLSPVNRTEFFRNHPEIEKIEQDGRLLLLCPTVVFRTFLAKHAKSHDLYTGTFEYPWSSGAANREAKCADK